MQSVVGWPAPIIVIGLRPFLGLENYYQIFIKGYSKIVSPLTNLLKKDRTRDLDIECQMDFEIPKQAVSK